MSETSPSTPALASQSRFPTEPPPPASAATIPPMPPRGTFDTLPQIAELLERLLMTQLGDPSATGVQPVTSENDPENRNQPLDIQQLATAAATVKVRIQKARQSLKGLPDLDRTIEEQQEEIDELEETVQRLRGVLRGIAENVGRTNSEDVKMEG